MDEIIKRRSIFYPAGHLYGGIRGFYDFGDVGTRIRRRIINLWRRFFVLSERTFEVEGSVVLPKQVFIASGHLEHFNDPIIQCAQCHAFFRLDKLLAQHGVELPEAAPLEKFRAAVREADLHCPKCGAPLSADRVSFFNLMFPIAVGPTNDEQAYLRPETCQSMFSSFDKILEGMRRRLPFGVAQVGKVFRNEISPRRGLVRLREITQMEFEFFFAPDWDMDDSPFLNTRIVLSEKTIAARDLPVEKTVFKHFMAKVWRFFEALGIEHMRFRQLADDEKAFYAKYAFDLEVKVGDEWLEVVANNYRQDYDLKHHSEQSGVDLRVDGKIPHLWEISMGLDRIFYALLSQRFTQHNGKNLLKLPAHLSPYQAAVFPLMAKPDLVQKARAIQTNLIDVGLEIFYDEKGSIGKRYARTDEIGVRYAITVDYQTLEDNTVTVRDAHTTHQTRVPISALAEYLNERTRWHPRQKPNAE